MEKEREKKRGNRELKKYFPIGTITLFGILVCLVIAASVLVNRLIPDIPNDLAGVLRPAPRALQPIAFKDHKGRLYTLAELEGKWTFLFFGYTYCPDICPTTLTLLTSLVDQLGQEPGVAEEIQVVFVSVDPQRDKPETLARYLAYFNDEFVGITADETKTRAFADQFGALFFKERETDPENYLMAHASSIYLIGPNAEIIASFSPPHDHNTIASQFRIIRKLKS